MSRHKKTFAPRAGRSGKQNTNSKEDKDKHEQITDQDSKISLAKAETTQITYEPFKNRAFNKVEKNASVIQLFDKGQHVSTLHNALNKLGHKTPENKNLFWNETKTGIISFQRKNNINTSGTLNRETLLKMNEALNFLNSKKEVGLPVSERAKMLYEAFEHRTLGIFAGTDEDKVFTALEKLSYEERYELIQYYDATYKPKRKVGLVQDLYEELGNKDLFKAIRLLYANYEEPQPQLVPEPAQPEGELLQEVVVTGKGSWIKPKTKYAIEGQPIEFDCIYQYETPVMYAEGNKTKVPEVVRKVLIQNDGRVYNLFEYPFRKDTKTFRQDGTAISQFSINTHQSGNFTFVFFIENTLTKEFRAQTKEYQVKTLEEAAAGDLKKNKIQNYSDFRQQAAFIEFNLSKGASKEQKSDPNFYIESATYSENPARVSSADINHIPQSYYSIKGKPIPKDHHYFWFAEINTPKEMFDGASALLGVEYAKNANVHGYKRGEYFGKDGWNMNSSQTTAAFLGSLTGVYTIHCLVLDKNNNLTGQEASYRQVILPKDDYQALKNIREYKKNIDKSFNTIAPQTALAINAVAINEETTETLSLNLFIGKSKKNPSNYVLTDLTPGVQHQRTYEGNNLKDLFEEFDSKNTYPDGILAYEIPSNTLGYPTLKGNFTTDGASFWESLSTGAGWASLGFAVAGLVASFTPAAPIAPYLFIAAGTTGATSGTASIIDKVQKGTLTNETLTLDVIMIASSFLGMAGTLSSIAKASSIIKISSTGIEYIILTDFALNGTAAVMITSEGLKSIQDIHDNKNLTTAEKIERIVGILGQLTLTAGLLVLSSKNLKGGELEKLPKVKRQTSKKPYNPEQHSEFIDTPENLTGGKSPKLTIFKPKSKTSVKNVLAEREAFWKELKEKYFPENDWSKTDFVTEGIDFNKFKSDHPNLFDEMAAKYDSMAAADRFLPGLIESGSSIPFKVTFNKGDELFKIVPKGGNIDGPSPYYLTKSELDFVKQHPERLEQVLGLPLSSTTSEYDVFKMVAKKDNISGFESIIAQTKQSAKSNPGDFYETTGGKKQTLIIDNMESGTWEKIAVPVEAISPKSLPKID
ncbi:peptidoglycan-binding domain-containing protein [Chryseobacterium sp. KCF3-3]|uniref:peptidoglycan-binding domain-containing protein n=1 Tax=Chryseobacterium sp. KCF3-3 TaxID=3231511 RepID=UPI0038B2CD88